MKNTINCIAAYILYYMGDYVSLILELHCEDEDRFAKQWVAFWYPVYNYLMNWSGDIQGDGDGPWELVESADNGSDNCDLGN